MYKVLCLYDKEYREESAYDITDFPYDKLQAKKTHKKGGYLNHACTFDIETSTYYQGEEPKAFMYIWQFCAEGYVCFGRTWGEFQDFIAKLTEVYKLDSENKLVIYVHNLSFEIEYIRQFLDFTDIFATGKRKVLTAKTEVLEFRCSYRLSNMTLAKFIENTPNTHHNKGVDDLDYKTIRTPQDELTPKEYGYCYNDVMGLYECIEELLKDDTIKSIPLTSTGFVRRDCRLAMRKNKKNRKNFIKTALTLEQYKLLKDCFRGGNTASSRYMTNRIIENVTSYDISSSYPYVMLTCDYPIGKFMPCSADSMRELEDYNERFCTIGRYVFNNIRLKKGVPIPYIPVAKCQHIKPINVYNGRVLSAEFVEIALTNLDYDIIKRQYDWDDLLINDFNISRRGKLPQELRDVVLHYFTLKSKLRGDKEHEYEYNKAKNRLNSLYGMCVTDIVRNDIKIVNGEWEETPRDPQEELTKYYKSRNNFLSYQWGVFISNWGRVQLQRGLDVVGMDVVYCDTDSVKYITNHTEDFERLNTELIAKNKAEKLTHSIDWNGKTYTLGIFDLDGEYDQFITLGAKKYAYTIDGHIGVTVSGLAKKKGAHELEKSGGLKAFHNGKVFADSGRTCAYYNNDPIHTININGVDIVTASNIAIIETTYTLGITNTMLEIIEQAMIEEYNIIGGDD